MSNQNIEYLKNHYENFPYPIPIDDLDKELENGFYFSDPSKFWHKIWPELLPYIDSYRNGKMRGGTTWFSEYDTTAKKAAVKFYNRSKGGYIVKEIEKNGLFVGNSVKYIE